MDHVVWASRHRISRENLGVECRKLLVGVAKPGLEGLLRDRTPGGGVSSRRSRKPGGVFGGGGGGRGIRK